MSATSTEVVKVPFYLSPRGGWDIYHFETPEEAAEFVVANPDKAMPCWQRWEVVNGKLCWQRWEVVNGKLCRVR